MKQEVVDLLCEHFDDSKQWIGDGYYRFRKDGEEYQLAYLIPGQCGTTTVHPQITLRKIDNEWVPVVLIDMGVSPTVYVEYNKDNALFLNEALKKLVYHFFIAKELPVMWLEGKV